MCIMCQGHTFSEEKEEKEEEEGKGEAAAEATHTVVSLSPVHRRGK